MNLAVTLLIVACVVLVCIYGFRRIPPMHIAVIEIFGDRWRYVKEGLAFLIPIAERPDFHSIELQKEEVYVEVQCQDLLWIGIQATFEYRIDVSDKRSVWLYLEKAKERPGALANSLKNGLGIIASTKGGRDFVQRREAIYLLSNCDARLEKAPHKNPQVIGSKSQKTIPGENRLDFYQKNAIVIEKLLDEESQKPNERSNIEERYGIDIEVCEITKLGFTKETQAAFEKEQQDEALAKAAVKKQELTKSNMALGANFQEATNAAEQSLNQKSERRIHSFEGKPISINLGGGHE